MNPIVHPMPHQDLVKRFGKGWKEFAANAGSMWSWVTNALEALSAETGPAKQVIDLESMTSEISYLNENYSLSLKYRKRKEGDARVFFFVRASLCHVVTVQFPESGGRVRRHDEIASFDLATDGTMMAIKGQGDPEAEDLGSAVRKQIVYHRLYME